MPVYDELGVTAKRCVYCGSSEIRVIGAECTVCGRAMFRGETAFEAGNMLICRKCAEEVTV